MRSKLRSVMLVLCAAVFTVVLGGCSMIGGSVDDLVDKGALVNDRLLEGSVMMVCRGISIAAAMRRYNTPERVMAWQNFCQMEGSLGRTLSMPVNFDANGFVVPRQPIPDVPPKTP